MNLRFLETFVWVARLKSFRLTAEKLFTTQASVSSRIAALESELDVRLFIRDSKGVSLTPAGLTVLDHAERMLEVQRALRQSLDDDARLQQGYLRLGAMDTVIHTWLSPLVARLMERYPAVEIELTADTARNLCDLLQKGYLDVVFQTDFIRHETVRNLSLARYPMRWIAARGSLYDRDYASLEDLAKERIITFSKQSRPHQDVLNLLHAHGIAAPRVNCVNSASAITRLVQDGFGIGALPPALVARALASGELVVLGLDSGLPPLEAVASWRTGVGLELVERVVEIARAVVAEQAGEAGAGYLLPADVPA